MTLGEIIKLYRLEHGMSMDAFSDKSGISKSYISLLEKNQHPKTGKPITPSIQRIKQAADAMGIDFNVLFSKIDGDVSLADTSDNAPKPTAPITTFTPGPYRIPIVGRVAAGLPIYSGDEIEGYIDYDKDTAGLFALRIKGDSMDPPIMDGSLVIVDQEASWEDGDTVVVTVNGDDGTCKRIKKYSDSIALLSNNTSYDPQIYGSDQIRELPIEVRGKVIEMRYKF